jgi:hypothetical protein
VSSDDMVASGLLRASATPELLALRDVCARYLNEWAAHLGLAQFLKEVEDE